MKQSRINSSKFVREGNTFNLVTNSPEPPIDTKYKIKDIKGEVHNIYVTSRNYVYFVAKDRNGRDQKRKVAKEIADVILKELGRIK